MIEPTEPGNGKTRKRIAVKAAGDQKPKKVKSTVHISREADIRLDIHCAMMGLDRSTMIERLINEHLRRYVVSDRGGQDTADNVDATAA